MVMERKRKTRGRNDIQELKVSHKKTKIEKIHLSDNEEDIPSAYQILVDSLPAQRKYFSELNTTPTTITKGQADHKELIADEDSFLEDDIFSDDEDVETDEPFGMHYEYNIKDEEVEILKQLYSQPLNLKQIQYTDLGSVQWLTTPTSHINWEGPDKDIKPLPLKALHVRQPLASVWSKANSTDDKSKNPFTSLQNHLFTIMNGYKDLVFTCHTHDKAEEIRRVYVLHALNHVIKNRSRVLKNNAKLTAASREGREIGEIRDQGLTRPKVLIIMPFRNSALKTVETMIKSLLPPRKGEVSHHKRFRKEYGSAEEQKPPGYKPNSYLHIFDGNTDDCFRVGVAVKKTSLRLYTKFYSCDVIIASPLGLRTIIGGEGDKERDFDFLSSLEIVIIDQTDVFLMQNWDHVMHLFSHLHLQPKNGHGVDFSRVREWALNGRGKYYCQCLLFSAVQTPEINSLVSSYFHNYEGQVRISSTWTGSVCQVVRSVPQYFHRIKSHTHQEIPDSRFKYFVDEILPKLSSPLMEHICVFIPSYFDFVRLRNHLKKEEIEFAHMSEYTKPSSLSRARTFFASGRRKLLLLTERLHFFRRYRISGIHHLVFYAPPTYPEFYSELINMMSSDSSRGTVTTLYSHYDVLSLQRVTGSTNVLTLIKSEEMKHTIVTGNL